MVAVEKQIPHSTSLRGNDNQKSKDKSFNAEGAEVAQRTRRRADD